VIASPPLVLPPGRSPSLDRVAALVGEPNSRAAVLRSIHVQALELESIGPATRVGPSVTYQAPSELSTV
jgi:hypothetical protein